MEDLITESKIKEKIFDLAKKISFDYKNKNLLMLSILKGSFVFASDLIREIYKFGLNPEIDFIRLKSYQGTKSTAKIDFFDNLPDVSGKDVLIIEDIFDTGLTLKTLYEKLMLQSPLSLNIAVLIVKNVKRDCYIPLKYVGFEIDNEFVVGYGLDYNEKFRGLPNIAVLK